MFCFEESNEGSHVMPEKCLFFIMYFGVLLCAQATWQHWVAIYCSKMKLTSCLKVSVEVIMKFLCRGLNKLTICDSIHMSSIMGGNRVVVSGESMEKMG